jgi:hypothetical protein
MSARPALAWIGASAIEGPSKAWAGLRQVLVSGGTSDDWADVLLDAKEKPSPEVPPLKETLRSWKRRRILDSDVFERLADELKGRAGRLVDVWHTGFVEAVYGSLFDAMATGKTLAEWAEEAQSLLDQFGADAGVRIFSGDRWSAWYADLVFRNANAAATAGGRYAEMFSREWIGRSPYWLYDAINDGRTRPEHAALDGLVFLKDDVTARRLLPPSAHNCFPGETLVSCAATKGFRASYAGPVVALDTERGQSLTLTVNHPVLTARGWIAAQELREGDEVFAERAGVEGSGDTTRLLEGASFVPRTAAHPVAAVGVDFDERPSRADERFHALGDSLERSLGRVNPEDFDGDARFFHGDVDAVAPLGTLLCDREAPAAKLLRQLVLETATAAQARAHRARRSLHLLAGLFASACGVPGRGALALDGGAVAATANPLLAFGPGPGAEGHAGLRERQTEFRARDSEPVGKALQALSGVVRGPQLRRHDGRPPSGVPGSVGLGRSLSGLTRVGADCKPSRQLTRRKGAEEAAQRLAGLATRIRRVEMREFIGDVFDFETAHGSIVAGGIVISNCRCAALELDEKDLAAGEYRVTESKGLSPDVFPGRGWDADRVESLVPATLRSVARGAA